MQKLKCSKLDKAETQMQTEMFWKELKKYPIFLAWLFESFLSFFWSELNCNLWYLTYRYQIQVSNFQSTEMCPKDLFIIFGITVLQQTVNRFELNLKKIDKLKKNGTRNLIRKDLFKTPERKWKYWNENIGKVLSLRRSFEEWVVCLIRVVKIACCQRASTDKRRLVGMFFSGFWPRKQYQLQITDDYGYNQPALESDDDFYLKYMFSCFTKFAIEAI